MRTAYRCRASPDQAQQAALNRTFGCVRVVWNRALAARQARWQLAGTATSYAESDRALTAMKKDPDLAFLNEVSSVPLQQALRHQHQAFAAFFARSARYPRFKSRRSRQSAHYTRSAFTMRGGALRLAKTSTPLRQLRAPARDAADLAQVLAEPDIGGFAVTMVIGQTAQQIRLAVGDFLEGRGPRDLLLPYLSSHGLLDARRRLYFAATGHPQRPARVDWG